MSATQERLVTRDFAQIPIGFYVLRNTRTTQHPDGKIEHEDMEWLYIRQAQVEWFDTVFVRRNEKRIKDYADAVCLPVYDQTIIL